MPFDPDSPNEWINEITQNEPPFIRSLCKSLYWESHLVRLPAGALLCKWGITGQGRVGVINENDPDWTIANTPRADQMLPAGDAQYEALVRQEDADAQHPWAFLVAAFKFTGGNVPLVVPGADGWQLLHLYEALTRYTVGNRDEAARAARCYTQSAGLVVVHPVVYHLMAQCSCIVNTLRARAFTGFNNCQYDPAHQFEPQAGHDNCGFVIRP